jgi:hypothetical protein
MSLSVVSLIEGASGIYFLAKQEISISKKKFYQEMLSVT